MAEVINNIDDFIKENGINRIYLDWDGVITHSCQAIVDICNKLYHTNVKGVDVTKWDFTDVFPTLKTEVMEALFEDKAFFENLKFIDGVVDFMKRYKDEIIIVTKSSPKNFIGKINKLKEVGLEDISIIPIPFKENKNVIDMLCYKGETVGDKNSVKSLFIDDNVENLWSSDADFAICFKEYNDDKDRQWQRLLTDYVMYHW